MKVNNKLTILKKLELFHMLDGYLGAGVFTPDGRMLRGTTEVSGVSFEIAGSLFHGAYLITDNRAKEAGFGEVSMLQVNTKTGIVFAKCYKDEESHFHTILVVKNGSNVAMAKMTLTKVIEELKTELKGVE
jgi:roadblock/LC7 domain-containing protein